VTGATAKRAALAGVVLLAWAGDTLAQQAAAPTTLELQLGPVSLRPRIELRDVGVDDNVFNATVDPQSDFTATIAPRVDAGLRMGLSRLTAGAFAQYVYFQKFEEERSFNRGAEARLDIGEGLLRPYVLGSIEDTRERLNPEIDARARHRQSTYGGGVSLALTSRSSFVLRARRATLEFEEGERYRGVELGDNLDETVDTFDTGLRISLTPLTAWETTVGVQRDRFRASPLRDSDSKRYITALEFSPSALISGRAAMGYRTFTPVDPLLAEFNGFIALISVGYAVEGTRLDGTFEHDVRYSFEEDLPYYVSTNGRFTATQRLAGPLDLQLTVARYLMSYRAFEGGEAEARRDDFVLYGAGTGCRLGEAIRFGVNVEWSRRRSDEELDRDYDRRRIFSTLTYGF
jgi:hypothetical protein